MTRVLDLTRGVQRLSPLTSATALIYAMAALAMLVGTIWYDPGKNPRWVIGALSALAAVFTVYALLRGRRFGGTEATAMLVVYLGTISSLTWTSGLDLAAFSNGLALPLLGIYTSWLLPRRAAFVFYAGLAGWAVSVAHRGDHVLTTMALIIAGEALVMSEVVRVLVVRITKLMYTDPLTGVLNRAGLIRRATRLISAAVRGDHPLSIAVIDLDGLRDVNNTGGHRAGDELLTRAAQEWLAAFPDALVGRIGGDEFVVVFAGLTADRAHRRLADAHASAAVGWTWGVAQLDRDDTLTSLIDRADLRMYDGKGDRV